MNHLHSTPPPETGPSPGNVRAMLARWKYHIRLIAMVAVFAALPGAAPFFGENVANAQGVSNGYVDVGLTLEVIYVNEVLDQGNPGFDKGLYHDVKVSVVNNGSRPAYDVVVVLDVVYPEDDSHFEYGTASIDVPVGSASLERSPKGTDDARLRWTIGELGVLQGEEYFAVVHHNDEVTFDNRAYSHEIFGKVTTSSYESNLHTGNNTSRVWSYDSEPAVDTDNWRQVGGNYTVNVSVDEPSPSPGAVVEFTIAAGRAPLSIVNAPPIDLEVGVELTGGLSVSGTPRYVSTDDNDIVVTTPSSVRYRNGVFEVGTLEVGAPATYSVTLPVTVASDAVVNEQCLTAKLTGNPPAGSGPLDDDISDNVVKLCLGEQMEPTTSGQLDAFTIYPCVGNTDPPCDNTDDVRVRAVNKIFPPGVILSSGKVFIHAGDKPNRKYDSHANSVNAGSKVSWQVPVIWNADPFSAVHTEWSNLRDGFTASGNNDGAPPGKVHIRAFEDTAFPITYKMTPSTTPPWTGEDTVGYNPGDSFNGPFTHIAEFEKLGTYKVQFTAKLTRATPHGDENCDPDGNNVNQRFCATEAYTFHVGPIIDLEVRDGGAQAPRPASGQVSYTVEAVNNGPWSAAASVVDITLPDGVVAVDAVASDGSYSNGEWDLGALRTADNRRSSGNPEAATLTLILDAAPGDLPGDATATISYDNDNHPYNVCIGSDGTTASATTETDCNAITGASWHEGTVYDYNAANDSATLTARSGGSAASTTAVVGVVLDWDPADDVNGLPVTEYEIQRQEDPEREDSWALLATVPAPQTHYVDTALIERAEPYLYRVRALNGAGIPGPWLIFIEAIVGAQAAAQWSEVALALTPATIGETTSNVAEITATLENASGADIEITVSAEPAAGSGTVPEDFMLSADNTLIIPAGSLVSRGNVVTVTANDDGDSSDERITISATATNAQGEIRPLTLTIDDDDKPGLNLGARDVEVVENATADFTVRLNSQPTADVTVRLTSDNEDVSTQPEELTFTPANGETEQTVTVIAAVDDDAADDLATITLRASGASEYSGVSAEVEVAVTDIDEAGVKVVVDEEDEENKELRIDEGGRGTYNVSLATEPAGNVVITVESDHDSITTSPSRFTLSRGNWERGQDVTVRSRDDNRALHITATLTHEVDADATTADEYDEVDDIDDVDVVVTDDEAAKDYDADDNGLLEITTWQQLNAIRWDLDGDGLADDDRYAQAFPRMMRGSCGDDFDPETSVEGDPNVDRSTERKHCTGYELMSDIALSGSWTPIGGSLHFDDFDTPLEEYRADFDGNGNTISRLSINLSSHGHVGLFGAVGGGAEIRNVGLEGVNVRGRKHVGALVGRNGGMVSDAWSTGKVSGNSFTGGLVGWNMRNGAVERSYSEADVTGWNASDSGGPIWSTRIAGLVGGNYGRIANTYATGSARGRGYVAGLAGENSYNHGITNSYAIGAVSTEEDWPLAGGLVGLQGAAVTGSYWNIETSGRSDGAGQGELSGAVGLDTTALQSLTAAATGWCETIWDFGMASDYPTLLDDPRECTQPQQQQAPLPPQPQQRASVTVDPTGVTLPEGSTGSYSLKLDAEPTADVQIRMSISNPDVEPYPNPITFTPDNWQERQLVGVPVLRDDDAVDDIATIRHEASGGNYNDATIADVTVSITDEDTAGIRVSETDLSVNEGGTATYTVSLDAQPVENVSIFVAVTHGVGVTTQPTQLTFTPANWRDAQTVTVSAAQDHNTDDETAAITHGLLTAPGSAYDGLAVAPVVVSITDDDELVAQPASQAGRVSVEPLTLTVTEGGDGVSYEVSLEVEPSENVVVAVSSNDGDVTVQPSSLTFTPGDWETAQSVTVSAAQDEDQDNDAATITHTVSGGNYDGVTAAAVAVTVTDDDAAQPAQQQEPVPEPGSVTVSAAELDVGEGSAATYTVVLDIRPSASVVIDVSSDNADVGVQPDSLTFTADDWQMAQTVTVSAADDEDSDDETAIVSHAVRGGNYDGVTAASVAVSVTDDDEQEAEEPAEPVSVPDPNRAALEAFYNATGGASWTNSANWLSEKPLGEWHGVTVNGQGEVTALVLDGNNLTGSLPAELGNLSGLTRLALNRNAITGAIPSQLGSLSGLSIIGIARNQLSGTLPTELGNLSGLTRLSLHDNTALSGALPSGFTGLTSLQRLAIANTGICIPAGDAFSDWLGTVSDKPGIEGLTACASP